MSQGKLASLDVRDKVIGKNPIPEVERRMGGPLGDIGKFLLKQFLRPINIHKEGATITMEARLSSKRTDGNFHCAGCDTYHTTDLPDGEIPLVVGDSQLRDIHINELGRRSADEEHLEYLVLPGTRLDGLASLTCYYYSHVKQALKIVMVGGYNDVLHGRSRGAFMESLETFRQLLAELDSFHGRPTNSSKIVVSTLMLAPAILLMNGDEIVRRNEFLTKEGERLHRINNEILSFNASMGFEKVSTPLLESMGRRQSWKNNRLRYSVQRTWWRESRRSQMLHLHAAHRHVLLGKIKRTVRRVVASTSFLKLSKSKKYSKRRTEDMDLDKLTTDKSKDLKSSGSKKSYRTNEKPRDDLPRAMEGLHLDTSKQRGKGNTNPLNSRRIEFVAASSSSSSPGSTRNNNNNIKHGDCVAMSHGKGRTSRENNNKREDMPKKASGTSSSSKKEARSKIITRGTLARADKSSQTSSRSTPPSTPRIVQEVHFDRKNIRKIGRELRRKMTDALLRANMEANTSRKSS